MRFILILLFITTINAEDALSYNYTLKRHFMNEDRIKEENTTWYRFTSFIPIEQFDLDKKQTFSVHMGSARFLAELEAYHNNGKGNTYDRGIELYKEQRNKKFYIRISLDIYINKHSPAYASMNSKTSMDKLAQDFFLFTKEWKYEERGRQDALGRLNSYALGNAISNPLADVIEGTTMGHPSSMEPWHYLKKELLAWEKMNGATYNKKEGKKGNIHVSRVSWAWWVYDEEQIGKAIAYYKHLSSKDKHQKFSNTTGIDQDFSKEAIDLMSKSSVNIMSKGVQKELPVDVQIQYLPRVIQSVKPIFLHTN